MGANELLTFVLSMTQHIQLWTFAYIWLLNEPYENEVALREKKYLKNAVSLLLLRMLL